MGAISTARGTAGVTLNCIYATQTNFKDFFFPLRVAKARVFVTQTHFTGQTKPQIIDEAAREADGSEMAWICSAFLFKIRRPPAPCTIAPDVEKGKESRCWRIVLDLEQERGRHWQEWSMCWWKGERKDRDGDGYGYGLTRDRCECRRHQGRKGRSAGGESEGEEKAREAERSNNGMTALAHFGPWETQVPHTVC